MKRSAFLFIIIMVGLLATHLLQPVEDSNSYQKEFIERIARILEPKDSNNMPPKSIIIAQSILESSWGESELSQESSNYFGIKGEYQGSYVLVPTQEYIDGQWIHIEDKFRKYPDLSASIDDYLELMKKERYLDVLHAPDYKSAANALVNGGYATDPSYSDKLINIIESYDLHLYDY